LPTSYAHPTPRSAQAVRPPAAGAGSQALTGSRLRAVVARRKAQRKCRAASHFAVDGDRAVKLFDDPLRDRETEAEAAPLGRDEVVEDFRDRKSTRLNSSHQIISYAVFCLKKKKKQKNNTKMVPT